MKFQTIYISIATLLSIVIIIYSWKNKEARGSREFAVLCSAAMLWLLGIVLGNLSSTFNQQYIAEIVKFAGVIPLPVTLFIFTLKYCSRNISRRQRIYLFVIPLISFVLMATSLWQQMFFTSMEFSAGETLQVKYGYYFWFVHIAYSHSLSLLSMLIVFFEFTRTTQRFRTQIAFLFLAMCLPIAVNILYLSGVVTTINLMPISFISFMVVSGIGIFRYQFLSNTPIAYETVFKTSRDGVVILDQNNIIADANPAAIQLLNEDSNTLIGKTIEEYLPTFNNFSKTELNNLINEKEFEIELKNKFFSTTIIPIDNGTEVVTGKIINIRDITSQKEHQSSLETLAFYDPLTMLANRRKFNEEFANAIKTSKEENGKFAILYFDLNKFKVINDTMGHKVGDELLKYVAARIASILRKPDILARLGGDEFVAILYNADEKGVEIAVKRIIENTQRPFKVKDQILTAELSVGAAFYPYDGDNLVQLLNHADTAMYRAKTNGGGLAIFNKQVDSSMTM